MKPEHPENPLDIVIDKLTEWDPHVDDNARELPGKGHSLRLLIMVDAKSMRKELLCRNLSDIANYLEDLFNKFFDRELRLYEKYRNQLSDGSNKPSDYAESTKRWARHLAREVADVQRRIDVVRPDSSSNTNDAETSGTPTIEPHQLSQTFILEYLNPYIKSGNTFNKAVKKVIELSKIGRPKNGDRDYRYPPRHILYIAKAREILVDGMKAGWGESKSWPEERQRWNQLLKEIGQPTLDGPLPRAIASNRSTTTQD